MLGPLLPVRAREPSAEPELRLLQAYIVPRVRGLLPSPLRIFATTERLFIIGGSLRACDLVRHPHGRMLGTLLPVRAREPGAESGLRRVPAFALPRVLGLLQRRQ